VTEEQRSQPAFSAKALWAAVLLAAAGVGSAVTARGGDAPALAALAAAKIPPRRTPRNFKTGSKAGRSFAAENWSIYRGRTK
jgi:hypothetical protein